MRCRPWTEESKLGVLLEQTKGDPEPAGEASGPPRPHRSRNNEWTPDTEAKLYRSGCASAAPPRFEATVRLVQPCPARKSCRNRSGTGGVVTDGKRVPLVAFAQRQASLAAHRRCFAGQSHQH